MLGHHQQSHMIVQSLNHLQPHDKWKALYLQLYKSYRYWTWQGGGACHGTTTQKTKSALVKRSFHLYIFFYPDKVLYSYILFYFLHLINFPFSYWISIHLKQIFRWNYFFKKELSFLSTKSTRLIYNFRVIVKFMICTPVKLLIRNFTLLMNCPDWE